MQERGAALAHSPVSHRPAGARAGSVVLLIAVSHGATDAYAAFLHPLVPRIMDKLGLSIALAATLGTVLSVATSAPQPILGYLADRFGRRLFLVAGPVVAGVFFSLIGAAPSFWVLLVVLVLGGLGSAAFHPPGASLVARAADGRGSGVRLSIFSFGGAAGFAAGPIAAVALVGALGLEAMWVAMIPGLVLGVVLWLCVRGEGGGRSSDPPPPPREVVRLLAGPLGLVFGISAVGAFAQRTFLTFEPIIAERAGVSEAAGAAMLSVYLGAQALGTLTSGFLTDRFNRQHILIAASALAVPVHILAVVLVPAGGPAIAATIVAGFLNMALLPPVVVMAQEMVPSGTAASSGIVMGLAWATGSLLIPVSGAFGDVFGPVAAAAWSMPLLLLGTVFAMHPSLKPYSLARGNDP
ncbi:MAG: MFS transporter [Gemmatimonadetes bacterium]|nr:MFS transporter [Gemmatimonadota bacterium]